MLHFLSFLVLLYVSGHLKQKSQTEKNSGNKQGEFVIFDYQSEKVQVVRNFFVMGCILKYYLQDM